MNENLIWKGSIESKYARIDLPGEHGYGIWKWHSSNGHLFQAVAIDDHHRETEILQSVNWGECALACNRHYREAMTNVTPNPIDSPTTPE